MRAQRTEIIGFEDRGDDFALFRSDTSGKRTEIILSVGNLRSLARILPAQLAIAVERHTAWVELARLGNARQSRPPGESFAPRAASAATPTDRPADVAHAGALISPSAAWVTVDLLRSPREPRRR